MNAKLLERMKRLLAMSQDKSSENEAMIAAKRLHSLLSQHSMSMTDIESKQDAVDEESFETVNFPWRRNVAAAVARLYYCDMYYMRGYKKNYTQIFIVGKPHHRHIAKVIMGSVFKIIEREAVNYSVQTYGKRNSTAMSSFKNGAAQRIALRCRDLIADARAGNLVDDETGQNLPVLASLYDQETSACSDFMNSKDLRTTRSTSRARDRTAMAAGSNAANKVPLSQGISKTAPKLLT